MESENRSALYEPILELLRALQRGNRFVSSAQGTTFSLVESHIAVEIDSHSALRAGELALQLKVDKSTVSRALTSLRKRRLIEIDRDPRDRRSAFARLSGKGAAILLELDQRANANMGRFSSAITGEELHSLRSFLAAISDAADISPSPQRPRDHPLRSEIRRITRALGLLGASVLGTELSSVQWHALSEIEARPAGCTAQQLSSILSLAPNTVSVLMATLRRRKLIVREQSKDDARKFLLRLSLTGSAQLKELRERASQLFASAFKTWEIDRLRQSIEILRRFSGINPPGAYGAGMQARRIAEPAALVRARSFALRELVRQGREGEAPETVIGSNSKIWALERDGEYFAIIEFQRKQDTGWTCALDISALGAIDARTHQDFAEFARRELAGEKAEGA